MAETIETPANIENVLIRAGACSVTVLPRFGGKIASIRVGEKDFHFASLFRCSVSKWDNRKAAYCKSGGGILEKFLESSEKEWEIDKNYYVQFGLFDKNSADEILSSA